MFQVPSRIEVVRWELTRRHYFDLLAVRTAVVEWAVEWVVKKLLGRVQKAGDYPRLLGCLHLVGLFDPFAPLGAPETTPVLAAAKNFTGGV